MSIDLGHEFRDPALLLTALTHTSFAAENPGHAHNERLELLGDAVLKLLVTEVLLGRHPDWDEGRISQLRGIVVATAPVAAWARRLGLGEVMRLGVGVARERAAGRLPESVYEACFEAVLGAVWLDGGLEAARLFLAQVLPATLDAVGESPRRAVQVLQESLQAEGAPLPGYAVERVGGPDHAAIFRCVLTLADGRVFEAEGPGKQAAKEAAARLALGVEGFGG